jgi:hypothetical protein
MYHLLHQVRPTVDAFETLLINAFSSVRTVEAIWVREVGGTNGRYLRAVWVQLGRASDLREIEALGREIVLRTHDAPFDVEIRVVIDDLPPSAVAPSCIYRRGSGRV